MRFDGGLQQLDKKLIVDTTSGYKFGLIASSLLPKLMPAKEERLPIIPESLLSF